MINRDEMTDLLDRTSLDALPRAAAPLIDALAITLLDHISNDPIDEIDIIDAIRLATIRLAYATEICPIHACDAQICADDNDLECAELRD